MEGSRGIVRRRSIQGIASASLGFLILFVLPPFSLAQQAEDWAEAVFPERTHNFGTVARGSILRHTFRITNRTNREVSITGWKPKCGCTEVTVGAQTIPPGTQTTIEAVLDTSKFHGYKASGLTLTLDQPSLRSIDYDLSCFIQDEVVLDPGILDFGEVKRGGVAEASVELRYLGGQREWRVVDMKHADSSLSAELKAASLGADGVLTYRLLAKLDPKGLRNGFFRDEIRLVTNDPQRREIPISVAAKVSSEITISPAVLNLGSLKAGQKVERVVLIKGTTPFHVSGTKAVEGTISTVGETPDTLAPLHQVRVAIEAPATAGAYHAVLELTTDRPGEPPARISAFATVVP